MLALRTGGYREQFGLFKHIPDFSGLKSSLLKKGVAENMRKVVPSGEGLGGVS
ncbi:MAG: hypothetical protein AAF969_02025 [Bacteroidota bacterium]